ncbi:MAG: hypothetical protein PHI98_06570 [Eubacteriales bacterium]|nr:hypothetical protein [Eubacteriales bacterium]
MSVLITDAALGVTLSPPEGVLTPLPCALACPYMPCGGRDCFFICCRQSRDCLCYSAKTRQPTLRMPAPPELAALCPSPCGRYLYQLSTEADTVHTLHLNAGELCYAAPVGVFPRSMRLHPSGRWLLIAGGAAPEAILLRAPELVRDNVFYTKGPCFAADYWRGGLVLVCAAEGDDIQTVVSTLAPGALRPREVQRLPGQPGGLCVCPDGTTALLSTPDGLMKLDLSSGKLLWNLPEWALSMKIHCQGGWALLSDAPNGQVCLLRHEQPWIRRILLNGTDAQACFCALGGFGV